MKPIDRDLLSLSGIATAVVVAQVFAVSPVGAQNSADPTAARIQRIENGLLPYHVIAGQPLPEMSIAERMKRYNVPGVSIAVIDSGELAWARGYGETEAGGAPVDTTTLFQAASISKPVAAMAALRLVEQGALDLDEDVNAKLRSWRVPANGYTRTEHVTLRRLLSHNAGLTVHGFRGYAANEAVPSVVQVLDGEDPANSAPVRVDTMPGAIWRYSGGGFTVAQLLMADVTGRAFPALMRELVFDPAGMTGSTYQQPLPDSLTARAATGHRGNGQPVAGKWHTYPEMAAAGLWTTPSDLARLAIEVQRSLQGESNRVISAAMTREMLSRQAGSYGLGFGLNGSGDSASFAHGGANEGFRAQFFAFNERGQGAVIMTNGDNGSPLAIEILRAIAREYGWPAYRVVERHVADVEAATLRELAGSYTIESPPAAGQTITVGWEKDGLHAEMPFLGRVSLRPASAERFFMLEMGGELVFERDQTGAVTQLVLSGLTPEPITARRVR
ncbi:MAG: serine hydrolase domain-containing protein [Longimicrobiales bacterium]